MTKNIAMIMVSLMTVGITQTVSGQSVNEFMNVMSYYNSLTANNSIEDDTLSSRENDALEVRSEFENHGISQPAKIYRTADTGNDLRHSGVSTRIPLGSATTNATTESFRTDPQTVYGGTVFGNAASNHLQDFSNSYGFSLLNK